MSNQYCIIICVTMLNKYIYIYIYISPYISQVLTRIFSCKMQHLEPLCKSVCQCQLQVWNARCQVQVCNGPKRFKFGTHIHILYTPNFSNSHTQNLIMSLSLSLYICIYINMYMFVYICIYIYIIHRRANGIYIPKSCICILQTVCPCYCTWDFKYPPDFLGVLQGLEVKALLFQSDLTAVHRLTPGNRAFNQNTRQIYNIGWIWLNGYKMGWIMISVWPGGIMTYFILVFFNR